MTSPPLVYMMRRHTVRFPKRTLYSHLCLIRCEDHLFVTHGLHNVIFLSPYLKLAQNPSFQTPIPLSHTEKACYLKG